MKVSQNKNILPPGTYSAFALKDDSTWSQPTYKIGSGWTEQSFERVVSLDHGAFICYGVMEDPEAPDDVEDLGDFQ